MAELLSRYYTEMLPAIEQELKEALKWQASASTDELFAAMQYHFGWRDASFQPVESRGGKRIRPLLCLLSCAAVGGEWRRALPAAAGVELIHNFSLIHDDIEDVSATRRGHPTVWKLLGIPKAINVGDSMFALAHIALMRLVEEGVPVETIVRIFERFDKTCLWLTEGQHADMTFEEQVDVSVDEYSEMIRHKTAVLLATSAEIGALVAGVDSERATHFRHFGIQLGLAFQVKDDILGIWGDEEAIGKSAASDIATRKKTMPVLFGLRESADLRELYAQPDTSAQFVSQVVALLDNVGAKEFAHGQAAYHSQGALMHLESAEPAGEAGEALYELTHTLLGRDS
jgi:geranylgeranyl diphosphate synthase type I